MPLCSSRDMEVVVPSKVVIATIAAEGRYTGNSRLLSRKVTVFDRRFTGLDSVTSCQCQHWYEDANMEMLLRLDVSATLTSQLTILN